MGVYNRLGGKDGLVDALLIKGFDRLRATVEAAMNDTAEPSMRARFVSCGLSYRRFALDNPHFYAIMFEDAILHEHDNPEVEEHAKAAFGALVRIVELSAAAGVIAAPDPVEVAQQIWSTLHGAVARAQGPGAHPRPAVHVPDPPDHAHPRPGSPVKIKIRIIPNGRGFSARSRRSRGRSRSVRKARSASFAVSARACR